MHECWNYGIQSGLKNRCPRRDWEFEPPLMHQIYFRGIAKMKPAEKKSVKTFVAKRNISTGYSAEYRVEAYDKEDAIQKIYKMCGERLKVTEK